MPRRNRTQRKQKTGVSVETIAKRMTTDQMARDLVKRGLADVAILGHSSGLRRERETRGPLNRDEGLSA